MQEKRIGRTALGRLVLLCVGGGLWLSGARHASGDPVEDGTPSGTVAHFIGGACPAGWAIATEIRGRLVVGVIDGTALGGVVGAPLGDQEDREHQHTYSGMVNLPDKSIAAADGGNTSGAKAGSYRVMGNTAKQTSGLPFVQVQACVKK